MKKKTAKRSRSELEKLTDARYRLFAKLYVLRGNGSRAYIEAGFEAKSRKAIRASASRLLTHVNVQKYIQQEIALNQKQLAKKYKADKETIFAELATCGMANLDDYGYWEDGELYLKDSAVLTREQKAAIAEVYQTEHGIRFKLHDKRGSLETLAQMQGWVKKKIDITSGGQPVGRVIVEFVDVK